jgi:hypothetical protein
MSDDLLKLLSDDDFKPLLRYVRTVLRFCFIALVYFIILLAFGTSFWKASGAALTAMVFLLIGMGRRTIEGLLVLLVIIAIARWTELLPPKWPAITISLLQ